MAKETINLKLKKAPSGIYMRQIGNVRIEVADGEAHAYSTREASVALSTGDFEIAESKARQTDVAVESVEDPIVEPKEPQSANKFTKKKKENK